MISFEEVSTFVVLLAALITALGFLGRRLGRFIKLSVKAFETIQREFTPNGGSTTYDAVRKTQAKVETVETELAQVKATAAEAVLAAATAVKEAKDSRDSLTEDLLWNRGEIEKTNRTVSSLESRLSAVSAEVDVREIAYVRALGAMGLPMSEVAMETLEKGRRAEDETVTEAIKLREQARETTETPRSEDL